MDNKSISGWIRQARYRAKKQNIHSDLEIQDIISILEDEHCSYCKVNKCDTLDHPFPLKDNAPNVPANVVTVCKKCKDLKKNNDLVWMYACGVVTEKTYLDLLKRLFERRGGNIVKDYVRRLSGYDGE